MLDSRDESLIQPLRNKAPSSHDAGAFLTGFIHEDPFGHALRRLACEKDATWLDRLD